MRRETSEQTLCTQLSIFHPIRAFSRPRSEKKTSSETNANPLSSCWFSEKFPDTKNPCNQMLCVAHSKGAIDSDYPWPNLPWSQPPERPWKTYTHSPNPQYKVKASLGGYRGPASPFSHSSQCSSPTKSHTPQRREFSLQQEGEDELVRTR